jgi:ATP-dependent Clp protease adapter protein ClpS
LQRGDALAQLIIGRSAMPNAFVVRIIGCVSLIFGIALAFLSSLALKRIFTVHQTFTIGAALPLIGCYLISVFCLFVGFRLSFNRPNRYGSSLTPTLWLLLAISFYGFGVISIVAAASRGEYQLLLVAVGFGVLGFGSEKVGRASRHNIAPSHVFPPETALLKTEGFIPGGFQFGLEILNDNRTPMVFVVSVLQDIVGLSKLEAIKTMLKIHEKGGILLPMKSIDQSKRVAELVVTEARGKNHPLVCRAVRLE